MTPPDQPPQLPAVIPQTALTTAPDLRLVPALIAAAGDPAGCRETGGGGRDRGAILASKRQLSRPDQSIGTPTTLSLSIDSLSVSFSGLFRPWHVV
jgi:hypothetical protein